MNRSASLDRSLCALAAVLLAGCPVPASLMTSGHAADPTDAGGTGEPGTTEAVSTMVATGDPHTTAVHTTEPQTTAVPTSEPSTSSTDTADATTIGTNTTGTNTTGTGTTDTGACAGEPELLADKLELPWSFSRQGAWIYFSTMGTTESETDGGVWRVAADGGVPELLSTHPVDGRWLATSEAGLFWSEYVGTPYRAGLDGGDPQVIVNTLARPIAIDATHFYWATLHAVSRVPLADGPVELLAGDFEGSYELALDDTRVYWTTAKTVETVGKDGSGRLTLAVDQAYASGVAADGEHVYWIDNVPCVVRRTPVTGGPIETLWAADVDVLPLPCAGGTSEIALDGDHLYWGGSLSVQRVAKAGGAREVIVEGDLARYVRDVMVDDTHVYWLKHAGYCNRDKTCDTGALLRVCKPA